MKALRRTALAGLALGVAGLATAHFMVDAELLRDAVAARLEAALGEPVELGAVDLSLFPLPAARIRDVRIGTPPAFRVEAPELRAGVSLAALLTGRIVLRSLELDAPRVRLPESALGSAWRSSLALESGNLDLKSALLRFPGRPRLDARFPGTIALDVTDAALALGQSLEKPVGVPLKLTATLAEPARALRFSALRIESDALRAQGELDLGGPSPILELHPASLDFSALASWTAPERTPRAGRVELASARVSGHPLALR